MGELIPNGGDMHQHEDIRSIRLHLHEYDRM